MATERKGPLAGMKVVEISNIIAGPFCTLMMADFGADVIKIEMPGVGDASRAMGPKSEDGESYRWVTMGRNKRCITLDLRVPEGRDIFLKLIKDADIVVENFRPGTIEKWGIGYDEMKKINPKIVLVRISGYGQTGPYAFRAGFGTAATAFAGLTEVTGYADRPPVSPPVSLADFLGGIFGFMGGMSAQYAVAKGDAPGQVVDVGLYEPMVRIMDAFITDYGYTGRKPERIPIPKSTSPNGIFKSKDGKWVVITASTTSTWERLAEAMGRDDMKTDPKFNSNTARLENDDEMMQIVGDWVATLPALEVTGILDKLGTPASIVFEVDDMFDDPQYKAREDIITVPHPKFGEVAMVNIFPKFSDSPCEVRWPGREVGAFNDEVYKGDLGMSDEEYNRLKEAGVI